MESSMSPQFGSQTGNALSEEDINTSRSDMVVFRTLFAVAAAISEHPHPEQCEHWQEVKSRLFGEQLAVIAGLAVGADVVYGDRPKETTYRRLLHMCSAVDLDRNFGFRSAQNYREALGLERVAPAKDDIVEQVLMIEREAVLCHSTCAAAKQAQESGAAAVVVVGAPSPVPSLLLLDRIRIFTECLEMPEGVLREHACTQTSQTCLLDVNVHVFGRCTSSEIAT
jgi:hypothetical protein